VREKKEYNLDQYNLDQFDDKASDYDSLGDGLDPITQAQITHVYTLFGELGMDKKDFGIEKVSNLKKVEAIDLIEQLIKLKEQKDIEEFDEDFYDYYNEIGEDLKFE
jgi:hypothetical protein